MATLAASSKNNGGRMIIAGGDADHIHILSSIGRIGIAERRNPFRS